MLVSESPVLPSKNSRDLSKIMRRFNEEKKMNWKRNNLEKYSSQRKMLSLDSVMEKNFLSAVQVEKCWGMITLDAVNTKERFGADFVVVIDVSASMNVDQKLYFVKQSVRFLLERLGEEHRFALIVFNHNVTVVCELLYCDDENKNNIMSMVDSLEASGSTNISDALLCAAEMLRNREDSERISSVMLITDGLCNRGLTGEETVAALTDISLPEGCVCNTFGFGEEHDSKSLHTIALNTHGVYYYVERSDLIPDIFNESVNDILDTVAKKRHSRTKGSGWSQNNSPSRTS
eukprot:TRINITY_DN6090_c0_g1_i1.p1 TRINITY_DN6090_c0_g1~~TRINITY_DN6090_c0_g1_i1.p1  ORF type:complete len:290 (-),score=52.06 TRINITY_DN6090_c0_g1_i1:638-1507(-)